MPSPEVCDDGIDNNCNGQVDCADRVCAGSPACGMMTENEIGPMMCTNGIDDDGDGAADCGDMDCNAVGIECCNGRDDDGDGFTDFLACRFFSDSDCVSPPGENHVCYTETFSACAPRCDTLGGDGFCSMIGMARCDRDSGQCVF